LDTRPPQNSSSRFFIYYGWYILIACFLLLFFQAGARFSFGVMFKPMLADFGWDRASISLAFFLNMTFFALTMSLAGRLYDRYGPKWIIFVSTLFLAAGYGCIASIDNLLEFHIYYGIIAAIGTGGASIPLIASLMSKWFDKHRGLAISLALSGNCIGQFMLVPLFSQVVIRFGWRASYAVIGLLILTVNTIIVLLVVKGDPQDLGLMPYGHKNQNRPETIDKKSSHDSTTTAKDLNLKQAMATSSFWLFLAAMLVCGSGDFLVITHLIPMVTDFEISATIAANMLAWFGLLSMGGILIAGPLSDLIGNKLPLAFTFVLRLFLFVMILKYQNLVSFYAFSVAFGFTFLITAPLTTTLVGRLYGFSHVGLLSGFITTVHHLGGGFWAYMGGVIFDKTNSYRLSFVISAILAGLAAGCVLLIKERRYHV
jgi:MFS family permease